MIIFLEGPDGCGKTTLAKQLIEQNKLSHNPRPMTYTHLRVHKNLFAWQAAALRRAIKTDAKGGVAIVDRHILSEQVYGHVYRNAVQHDVAARTMWEILQPLDCTFIFVLAETAAMSTARHRIAATKRDEMHKPRPELALAYFQLLYGQRDEDPLYVKEGTLAEKIVLEGGMKSPAFTSHRWGVYHYNYRRSLPWLDVQSNDHYGRLFV